MDKVLLCKENKSKCIEPISVPDQLNLGYQLGACTSQQSRTSNRPGINTEEQTLSLSLSISPNPAAQQAIINFTAGQQPYSLEVYNVYGVKVATIDKGINGGARTVHYNVAQLSAGLYLVKLAVNGKVMTEKLVVQR